MQKPALVGIVLALLAVPLPALAMGEGPKTSSGYSTEDDLKAKYGDLGTTYTAAVALAEAGQYQEAVIMFESLGKESDPRVLNYLGFTHRKLGKVDEAVAYYEKALALEPYFAAARSYLGEAYVLAGDLDKAKAQLAKIKDICGTGCAEYETLDAAITAHAAKS
jgi:Flp pilus assembly protein TadD